MTFVNQNRHRFGQILYPYGSMTVTAVLKQIIDQIDVECSFRLLKSLSIVDLIKFENRFLIIIISKFSYQFKTKCVTVDFPSLSQLNVQ